MPADIDAHDIAGHQVFRRLEADADARGRACCDHVAGHQRDAAEMVAMIVGTSK